MARCRPTCVDFGNMWAGVDRRFGGRSRPRCWPKCCQPDGSKSSSTPGAKFGRRWPSLGWLRPSSADVGPDWAEFANFGRVLPKFADIGPLAEVGPTSVGIAQKMVESWPESGRPMLGDPRANVGSTGTGRLPRCSCRLLAVPLAPRPPRPPPVPKAPSTPSSPRPSPGAALHRLAALRGATQRVCDGGGLGLSRDVFVFAGGALAVATVCLPVCSPARMSACAWGGGGSLTRPRFGSRSSSAGGLGVVLESQGIQAKQRGGADFQQA